MAAPIDMQFPLLLVQFWSATSFLLTPFALLLVAAAPKVRQPLHHDGIPWPPTDSWAQMFSIPLAGLSILAFLGAWGLLRGAGVRSISILWLLAGFCCCALGAWCFPGVGWLPPWMDDWAERRTPLFVALGLLVACLCHTGAGLLATGRAGGGAGDFPLPSGGPAMPGGSAR